MKAVHFGAGNIGRGFIGILLHQANYDITFVDVNTEIIDALNREKAYQVIEATDAGAKHEVSHIRGINNGLDETAVVQAIVEADLITTAIGPRILPLIAPLIAQGLEQRLAKTAAPLNIIACENMVNGSDLLKSEVEKHMPSTSLEAFQENYGFPNAAVDRIVPNQSNENILDVVVEPYYEWVVESKNIKGDQAQIPAITYVDLLHPYIERKLFTVNTGHAVAAFAGYYYGFATIGEAMQDKNVLTLMHQVLDETGEALITEYGFARQAHQTYQEKIIERFKNPHISDDVIRVARNPIQKLGANERFIRPALMYYKHTGHVPGALVNLIAIVLKYDSNTNDQAVQLQAQIKQDGIDKTLAELTRLAEDHPVFQAIIEAYEK